MRNYLNKMKKYIIIALVSGTVLTSCGEYNKVLKSTDYEYKYEAAKSYFGKGQNTKAATILEELITIMKGTDKAEESLYMLGMTYYNQGDFITASHYFTTYYNTYPRGVYTEQARYFSGKALFLDTPEPRLDQSSTYKAIQELQMFMEYFPTSSRRQDAQQMIFDLQDKLVMKDYLAAKLYYDLGSYTGNSTYSTTGNNYLSCIVTAQNALKDYPYTKMREEEIRKFVPKEYYGISLETQDVKWTWRDEKTKSFRTFSRERAEQIKGRLENAALEITSVEKKAKKTMAPGLYDLTTLQREANLKYGFSAKETLNIMQRLYENHKVLTYPRTDSRYIGKDIVPTIKERLKACGIGPYRKLAGALMNKPVQVNGSFVDDKRVSDHHAIIPTEQFVQLDHMTNEERKIYDMVVRRFLAVLYPASQYEQVTMEAKAAGETFAASGKVIKSMGWKEVYEGGADDDLEDEADDEKKLKDQRLPEMKTGTRLKILKTSLNTGKTKPPARFTEATLLAAMENPVKFMETRDKEAVKTLGETGGLGTVATRADIIEKLFHSFMMEKKGNEIHITSKAKQLLELVPEDLKKPELTADWEMKLSQIAKGRIRQGDFLHQIRDYTCEIVDEIKTGEGTFRHDNLTNKVCPQCGKKLLAVNGKNSKMLVCQDRECGYRETISRTTNARCPKCHKRMEMYVKGKEETFVCQCGYKEKLSAFQARRQKEGAGVGKRDVQNYLRRQQKEANEPVNNAFAQALSGIKL